MEHFFKSYQSYFHLLDDAIVYFYGLVLDRQSLTTMQEEMISYLVAKISPSFVLSGNIHLSLKCYDIGMNSIEKLQDPCIVFCQITFQLEIETEKGRKKEKKIPISCYKTVLVTENVQQQKEPFFENSLFSSFQKEYERQKKIFFSLRQKMEEIYLLQEHLNLSFLENQNISVLYSNEQKIYHLEKEQIKKETNITLHPQNFYQFFFWQGEKILFNTHLITDEYKIYFLDQHCDLLFL